MIRSFDRDGKPFARRPLGNRSIKPAAFARRIRSTQRRRPSIAAAQVFGCCGVPGGRPRRIFEECRQARNFPVPSAERPGPIGRPYAEASPEFPDNALRLALPARLDGVFRADHHHIVASGAATE
jgi:hypothetical protein